MRARYELPAFSTLERILGCVRALAHRHTCGSAASRVLSALACEWRPSGSPGE
jgi:hypothetical protein